ncbi:hypothetical protein FOL47_005195 [Perkinsus chesapeaki]|uniref:EF-hand domain-containing protein n=1 Tax=Perkinsus chesapeaki TaxID=330153 RepID=A0A7J6LZV3_PERCH|nr:hypothetical protein FOL47_005195 [Perkinsus chesapeaki]
MSSPQVKNIITAIQAYIFPRRVRMMEAFADFDPLRHRHITRGQFVRVLDTLQLNLSHAEATALADNYDDGLDGVRYVDFCDDVDTIFCCSKHLETSPTMEVPPPGHGVNTRFVPNDLGEKFDPQLGELLYRLAIVCKTRGFSLKYQSHNGRFGDFDRHNTGSITASQFFRKFPLYEALTDQEKDLLQQRYGFVKNGCEMVDYETLREDMEAAGVNSLGYTPTYDLLAARFSYKGEGDPAARDKWRNSSLSLTQQLQARVAERRLRLKEYFEDFDTLKKGACKEGRKAFGCCHLDRAACQAICMPCLLYCGCICHHSSWKSYGTNTRLKMANDIKSVRYCLSRAREFYYLALCEEIDVVFSDKRVADDPVYQTDMPGPKDTAAARRNARELSAEETAVINQIEGDVAAKVKQLRILLKPQFLNFDKCGRQTVTVSQFKRVFATLGFELTDDEMNLLAKKYTNMGNTLEVNYRDFCRAVDPPPPLCVDNSIAKNVLPSNYHDRKGRVLRAAV